MNIKNNMKNTLTTFQIWDQDFKVYEESKITTINLILNILGKDLPHVNLFNIQVSRKSIKKTNYDNLSNYSNTDYIKLLYPNYEEIKLPNNIRERLIEFIKKESYILKWNNNEFDCLSFVNYLNNIGIKDRKISNYNYYKIVNLELLKVWDIILTWMDKMEEFWHHYSLYLWKWFYLWILWPWRYPTVYDLESLQKIYPFNSKNIVKCVQKNK